jgi:hypothetical protein
MVDRSANPNRGFLVILRSRPGLLDILNIYFIGPTVVLFPGPTPLPVAFPAYGSLTALAGSNSKFRLPGSGFKKAPAIHLPFSPDTLIAIRPCCPDANLTK